MRKRVSRVFAAMMVGTMLFAIITGCKNDNELDNGTSKDNVQNGAHGSTASGNGTSEPLEFVYVVQSIPLPSEIGYVTAFATDGDKLYLAAITGESLHSNIRSVTSTGIYSMNIDGTDLKQLSNYVSPETKSADAYGGVQINDIYIDNDGSLWVSESWEFYSFDVPDGIAVEGDALWAYHVNLGSGATVRKLDTSGTETVAIFAGNSPGEETGLNVSACGIDGSGNIYMFVNDYDVNGGNAIRVYDNSGNYQFELDASTWFDRFVRVSDGQIAFPTDTIDATGVYKRVLQTIDYAAKVYGDMIDLPEDFGWELFSGSDIYDTFSADGIGIYGYSAGETSRLLSWLDCDVDMYGIVRNIEMTSGGHILVAKDNSSWGTLPSLEILMFKKTPSSEVHQKNVLTLATFYLPNISDAILEFNRTNPDYRIHAIDYSIYDTDGNGAGIARLTTEMISGNIPDILDVSQMPYEQYAARGLLADLYEFIDADPEVNRDDFVQGALRAAEINGKLYQLFPLFVVNTLVGNPSVVGLSGGWTMSEFKDVMDANPNAELPFGYRIDRNIFLQTALSYSINDYIDWEAGTTHFDSDDFVWLLEYSERFPKDVNYDYHAWDRIEAITTGKQIMELVSIREFGEIADVRYDFGSDVSFKGFPNANRNISTISTHSSFAITQQSSNKEGAWAFIRMLINDDWQLTMSEYGNLPINHAIFDLIAREAPGTEFGAGQSIDSGGSITDHTGTVTQADVNQLISLIDSAQSIAGQNLDESMWHIINSEVSDFYNGAITAQNAARNIQNSMSILVSERS